MKRLLFLAGLICTVAATTFVATTYRPVSRLGPYYTSNSTYDTATGGSPGGLVYFFKNGADTLIVGDVVYLSANNTVLKSGTLANYNAVAGVVVGGTKTNMQVVTSAPAATDTAAYANQTVVVLVSGRTWVRVDTTTAGISAGVAIMPSLVAGKVKARTTAIDTFSRIIGKMIDTGIASTQVLARINIK